MIKIAFIGEAGSGKDAMADYLAGAKFCNTSQFSFAHHLYKVARKYFPEQFEKGKPRKLLTEMGDFFRKWNPNVWIDAMFYDMKRAISLVEGYYDEHPEFLGSYIIMVTDCRYPNEYEALKEEGFTFVKVTTSKEVKEQRIKERGDNYKPEDLIHSSEQHVNTFECHYEIDNNGSLEYSHKQLENIVMMEKWNAIDNS